MDDPWGSPWATSDHPSRNELLVPPPSPPKALLSPPPRAFVGIASASPAQSPWVDDGSFGDWTGTDLTQNKKSLTDWGVWGDASLQQPPSTSSRHDGSGRASPLAWPSSAATSPGLKPLPRSRTSSIFRQSSPDPWAAEFSLKNRRDTLSSFSLSVHEDTSSKPEIPSEEVAQSSYLGIEVRKSRLVKSEDKLEEQRGTDIDEHEPNQPRVSTIITTSQDPAGPATKPVLNEIHEISPRPSSTFSHPSSQEIDRQDSPITSIDEDSKSRLQPSRKASGKVHELVGMYDDLTKATTIEEPPSTETRESPQRTDGTENSPDLDKAAEEDEDAVDFGEFEDVAPEGKASGPDSAPISAHSARPSTPRGHAGNTVPQTSTPKSPEVPSPGAKATSVAIVQLVEKFGPIQFDVDPKAVDKLFPAAAADELRNEADQQSEVPDRLVADSFTSISERKAWYRISRYGSKRKHDLGDDENYHRTTWSNSEVRGDTLKIVRRWMEEDSYTGRAVLGGTKRTSVFNWDSTAAPVDLNAVFGRKSSVHSRASSVQQQQQQPRHSTTSSIHSVGPPSAPATAPRASTSSRHTSEVPSTPIVAGFGWISSSISESPEVDAMAAATTTGKPRHSTDPPPLSPPTLLPTSQPTPVSVAPRAKAPSPIKPPHPQAQLRTSKVDEVPDDDDDEESEDDDDDWGEMVSSPQVEAHPSSIEQIISDLPKQSQSPPQQSQQQTQRDLPAVSSPTAAAAVDPWGAFGDLSAFKEKGEALPVEGSSMMGGELKAEDMVSTDEAEPSPNLAKASMPVPTPPVLSPVQKTDTSTPGPVPKATLGPIEETGGRQEQEQDEIVRRIVQGLPDLSYMLR